MKGRINNICYFPSEEADFLDISRVVNSPYQEARREARRRQVRRAELEKKVMQLSLSFLSGVVFALSLVWFL